MVGNGASAAVAPTGIGSRRSGWYNWPFLVAGSLVGVLVVAATAIWLGSLGGKAMTTVTPLPLAVMEVTPPLTPTPTRLPTSTIAPTATPTPTDTPMPTSTATPTFTPTPTRTPTPTPTLMSWEKLVEFPIDLDSNAKEAIADNAKQLCQNSQVEDMKCQPAPTALSIVISGTLENGSLRPDWGEQTSFISHRWRVEIKTELKQAITRHRTVTVLGEFPEWKPLLVMAANGPPVSSVYLCTSRPALIAPILVGLLAWVGGLRPALSQIALNWRCSWRPGNGNMSNLQLHLPIITSNSILNPA